MRTHTLAFDEVHVGPILDGRKTITLRYGLESDVRPGHRLEMVTATEREPFARATVRRVGEVDPRWVVNADLDGHRSYRSVGQLLDELRGYYPEASILPETPLDMLAWPDADRAEGYLREPLRHDPRDGGHA